MKKVLALILTLAMALSLAACGKSADKPDKSNPNVIPEDAWKVSANEIPKGRTLVKYWSPFGSGTASKMDSFINAFNGSQDTYFVVREYNGGYYDQIAKLMATEQADLPALCNSSSETVGSYLHSGLIKMMQDYIDGDSEMAERNLYGNLISTFGKDGDLIGYPVGLSLSGFWYNTAVFEKAGIDPTTLTSFDRVYEAALKIGEGGYAQYALSEEHSGIWANYAFAREGFYTTDNENGATGLPTKCLYDDNSNGFADIVTNYYTEWADLAAKGYLYPVGSSMKEELIPALAAGQLAMIVSTNSYLSQVQAAFGDSKDFGFIPMFSATDNGKQTGFCSSGNGFFIVDNGNKEAMKGAYEFVKFFTNVDNQIAWNAMTGYLPLYDDVYNSKEYQAVLAEYPYVQSVIEAMRSADNSAWYAFTATNNEYTLAGATCLEAVCNGTPVDQAIAEMCETINNAFEMYNATNS